MISTTVSSAYLLWTNQSGPCSAFVPVLQIVGVLLLLAMTGCGASGSFPQAVANPAPTPNAPVTSPAPSAVNGDIFDAVPFPLSLDTAGITNDQAQLVAAKKKAAQRSLAAKVNSSDSTTGAPGQYVNQWFYLINGSSLVINGQQVTLSPGTSPLVLTVSSPAPGGAPNPNGADGVTLAALELPASQRAHYVQHFALHPIKLLLSLVPTLEKV